LCPHLLTPEMLLHKLRFSTLFFCVLSPYYSFC